MTWVNLSSAFGYGTVLTSLQQQNLRDNITAAFAKDSGAPQLATNYIQNAMIADLQITEAKLGSLSCTRVKIKTGIGTVSGTLGAGLTLLITMQDYCFYPGMYASTNIMTIQCQTSFSVGTIGRFLIRNESGQTRDYDIDYRYITSSDEPFIFALLNKISGEIEHVWICDDPPPGYWGLDKKPINFKPPVEVENFIDYDEIILFKQEKLFIDELRLKKNKDKKLIIEIFDDYEFDNQSQLFKQKNISMI